MNEVAVTWSNQKQKTIAFSTMEAACVPACESAEEIMGLKQLLSDLSEIYDCISLYINNPSASKLKQKLNTCLLLINWQTFHQKHCQLRLLYF